MAGVVSGAAAPPMKRWKLLAVGALLAWLILVHLLVNVWLLLLFSAVMAAAGAWLGPQFILGSSTSIHLERFIALERSARSADAEDQLDQEIRLTVQKIVQDFVSSWYRRLSPGTAFEDEVRGVMWDLGMELKRRLRTADRDQLTRKLLVLAGCHLQCYKWAKARAQGVREPYERESLLWEAYQELSPTHPALTGSAQEVNHARWLVELLLSELVPSPHLDTRTGRHLVVELIACNVVLPLVGRMSDPDWINIVLTNVFSKTPLRMEEEKYEGLAPPSIPKSLPLGPDPAPQLILPSPPSSHVSGFQVVDGLEAEPEEEPDGGEESCKEKVDVFPVQYLQPPNPSSPFFLCEESEPESPMSDLGRELERPLMNSTEDLLSECGLDSLTPAESPGAPPYHETLSGLCDESYPPLASVTPPRPEILIESSALQSEFTSLPYNKDGGSPMEASQLISPTAPSPLIASSPTAPSPLIASSPTAPSPLIDSSPTAPSPHNTSSPTAPSPLIASSPTAPSPLITSSPTVPIHPFSFIPLSSPDGPVLIQNLRITGTITAREHSGTGSHPYTLYTIKYDTALDSQSLGTLQPMAYHTVNRRYREFLNLQTRLEERADLRKFIKHIKGPKKFLPDLPFGNMDSEKVEARKSQLESFLRQLCAVLEIASSEEVQEFLALNTDARIAFVKKPFLVSRIDKIVVNAIVDTLKTAFPRSEPQSPTDELSENEVDGKSQNDKRSTKSRLRFPSSKIAPVLSSCDLQEKILYSVREGSTVSDVLSLAAMESFIQKQEKLLNDISGCQEMPITSSARLPPPTRNAQAAGLDGGLSAVALEVLWLVMREQWSWLCTDNMQKVTHLLCGSLIQRWLEVQVDNFTCMQRWALYLRLLRHAIWPGGALRTQPRPPRTQTQRDAAYHQALQSLMGIIPDLVQEILGVQKCCQAWKSILDSLQNPPINRHLLYCIWDILLESLIAAPAS